VAGEDLLAAPALARQTRFLRRLVATLFPADTTSDRS
jgi:hypothetical protein